MSARVRPGNGLVQRQWTTFVVHVLEFRSARHGARSPAPRVGGGHPRTADRGGREIVFAALLLAAFNIAFNPALALVLLLLGAIGLYYLIAPETGARAKGGGWLRSGRRVFLGSGVALLGLTVLASFPLLWHLRAIYTEYYGLTRLHTGLRDFVPLSDAYGFSLYTLELVVGHIVPTPWLYELVQRVWNVASVPALLFALVVSGWGLLAVLRNRVNPPLTRGERATWFLLVGTVVFYLALLRLPFLRPYPYGFLKALSLVSLPLLALFAEGFFALPTGSRLIVWAECGARIDGRARGAHARTGA